MLSCDVISSEAQADSAAAARSFSAHAFGLITYLWMFLLNIQTLLFRSAAGQLNTHVSNGLMRDTDILRGENVICHRKINIVPN